MKTLIFSLSMMLTFLQGPGGKAGIGGKAGVGGGAAAPCTSPSCVGGLQAWYKADSLALTNGAPVTSWADSSGNGFTLTQATGLNQPTFETAQINSLPDVSFTGSNPSFMTVGAGGIPNTGSVTMFAVFNSPVSNGGLTFTGTSSGAAYLYNPGQDFGNAQAFSVSGFGNGRSSGGVSLSTWYQANVTFDAAGNMTFRLAEAANGTASFGVETPTSNLLQMGGDAGVGYDTIKVAEFIVFNHNLSGGDITIVETYLNGKYGI